MARTIEILKTLQHPLEFASRNDFAALAFFKDIERTLAGPVEKAMGEQDGRPDDRLSQMRLLVRGIDVFPLEEKRKRIRLFIELYKTLVSDKPPANGDGSREKSSQKSTVEINLQTPVKFIKGVGPVVSEKLSTKGIFTVGDALRFYPRAYEDRRNLRRLSELKDKEIVTVMGTVVTRGPAGRRAWEMIITDKSAFLSLKWFHFNAKYLERLKEDFPAETGIVASGKVTFFNGRAQIIHPELRKAGAFEDDDLNYRRIVPLYSKTEGVSEGHFLRIMQRVVEGTSSSAVETLPARILEKRKLISLPRALYEVHFPPDDASMEELASGRNPARRRLTYEELFFLQLGLALKKAKACSMPGIAFKYDGDPAESLRGLLPFELTGAQKRVIREIAGDMSRPSPMNRLLQGDVGSGKTAVAFAAMMIAAKNGYQSAMLAPTEILAGQHYEGISRFAMECRRKGLQINAVLLTGSSEASGKPQIEAIASGGADIVVGTHAVIEDRVVFRRLGLAVIDEQHRFGVLQRAALRQKGLNPDVLVMTATPIPRTLAMSLYGDLDLSVIDEMPPGRTPVHTKVFYEGQQKKCYEIIEREISLGRQCYAVYPLVEESEKLDLRDATKMAAEFKNNIFPDRRIGLLHGRMKDDEKNAIMSKFKAGHIDILVSTTVIEVGVDAPNATVMMVDHAERFGLSQLHQLRGRVGRGSARSYCLLLARYNRSEEAERRLKIMEKTTDGFVIAEEDLDIRGPGEFTGTRQSGLPDLLTQGLRLDSQILAMAREDAFELVDTDPALAKPEHSKLKKSVLDAWHGKLELSTVG